MIIILIHIIILIIPITSVIVVVLITLIIIIIVLLFNLFLSFVRASRDCLYCRHYTARVTIPSRDLGYGNDSTPDHHRELLPLHDADSTHRRWEEPQPVSVRATRARCDAIVRVSDTSKPTQTRRLHGMPSLPTHRFSVSSPPPPLRSRHPHTPNALGSPGGT